MWRNYNCKPSPVFKPRNPMNEQVQPKTIEVRTHEVQDSIETNLFIAQVQRQHRQNTQSS